MKTPMQELLKLESDLTHMFDSDERVAMAILDHIRANRKKMLEKEREVIENIEDTINSENSGLSAEERLKEIQKIINAQKDENLAYK
jgi:ElaB/YqjD/DUF883 family membrane-anchored ribosome-binding protein